MLRNIEGISLIELDEKDIIRHELVTKVVQAFRKRDEERERDEQR